MHKPLLGLLLLASACAAQAAVYRCDRNGQATYTDRPCAAGAEPALLTPATVIAPAPGPSLADAWDARMEREREQNRAAKAEFDKDYERRGKRKAAVSRGMRERKVVKGMAPRDVEKLLGSPDTKDRDDGPKGEKEKWTYTRGDGGTQTVTFEDGEVTAVKSSKGKKRKR